MTTAQKLSTVIAVLGFLAGATTQLTDLFAPLGSIAPVIVKEIVTIAGLASGIAGIFLMSMTGQVGQIKAVQAMPGVESIVVGDKANQTLAAIAVDTNQPKVDVQPGSETAVQNIAKG